MRVIAVAALLAACSANSTAPDADEDDFTCDISNDCVGTYLVSYDQISGDCAEPETRLTRIDSSDDPDCVETAPTVISDNGCKLEAARTCNNAETGLVIESILVIEQADESCNVASGTVSIQASDTTGQNCSGTYRVRYERQ